MGIKFLYGDKNIIELDTLRIAQLCKYTKSHGIVHFKWLDFMVM